MIINQSLFTLHHLIMERNWTLVSTLRWSCRSRGHVRKQPLVLGEESKPK